MRKLKIVLYIFTVICLITNCNKQEYDEKPLQLYYTDVYVNYLEDEKLENSNTQRKPFIYYKFYFVIQSNFSDQDKIRDSFLKFLEYSDCILINKQDKFSFLKFKIHKNDTRDTLIYYNVINFKDITTKFHNKKDNEMGNLIISIIDNPESKIYLYPNVIREYMPFFAFGLEFEIKRGKDFKIIYPSVEDLSGDE